MKFLLKKVNFSNLSSMSTLNIKISFFTSLKQHDNQKIYFKIINELQLFFDKEQKIYI